MDDFNIFVRKGTALTIIKTREKITLDCNDVILHKHTFRLYRPKAKRVYVVGEWNNWNTANALEMKKNSDGWWETEVWLEQGQWQYKFFIPYSVGNKNKGHWIHDPDNHRKIWLGSRYRCFNSIVSIGDTNKYCLKNSAFCCGKIKKIYFYSKILSRPVFFNIYLPPHYNTNQSYPVLLLLHGAGESGDQWVKDGSIASLMDNLIAGNEINPFIIAMPSAGRSWYNGKTEDSIINELFPYIFDKYSIFMAKEKVAISGVSMGGFGAFNLALKYPELFGICIPLSGYFPEEYLTDLEKEKFIFPAKLVLYCGWQDKGCFSTNESLVNILRSQNIDFTYFVSCGGHTWRYWHSITKDVLTRISNFFYESEE